MGFVGFARPYPFEPLQRLIAAPTAQVAADLLGVPRRRLYRLRDQGLTVDQADRMAIAAGYHPAEVWPTWLDDYQEAG